MFFQIVPVGLRFHPGPAIANTCRTSGPGLVGALLCASAGLFVGENLFSSEVWKFLVAVIAQKQRLAAITNKNKRIVRDFDLFHLNALTFPKFPLL